MCKTPMWKTPMWKTPMWKTPMGKTNALRAQNEPPADAEREAALAALAGMARRFEAVLAAIPAELWREPPAAGGFALVEHACHLRDIEMEGYRVRLERMLAEAAPLLPDLDGAKLARERNYLGEDLRAGLGAFASARGEVVRRLAGLTSAERRRCGTLEGVGEITIDGLVAKMLEHDREHLAELAALRGGAPRARSPLNAGRKPVDRRPAAWRA